MIVVAVVFIVASLFGCALVGAIDTDDDIRRLARRCGYGCAFALFLIVLLAW